MTRIATGIKPDHRIQRKNLPAFPGDEGFGDFTPGVIAVTAAQSTYDPRTITEWVGKPAATRLALQLFYGLSDDELDSPKAYKL